MHTGASAAGALTRAQLTGAPLTLQDMPARQDWSEAPSGPAVGADTSAQPCDLPIVNEPTPTGQQDREALARRKAPIAVMGAGTPA
jgi:hypothetical protein